LLFADRLSPGIRATYNRDTLAGILGAVMNGLTMPFFLMIAREKLHASQTELGVITAAPVAGFMLAFLWARMMEGKRKMPFAVGSWVASRCVLLLAPLVRDHASFVALVVVYWVVWSVSQPAYAALMKEIYPDSDRGRIMGYVRVCSYTVIAVTAALGGMLLHYVTFQLVFPVAGVFGIASALVFSKIPTKQTTGDANVQLSEFVFGSLEILLRDRPYRWFCAGIFVSGWANFMVTPLFTVYQKDYLGADTRWVGVYTIVMQTAAIISYYYWGKHVDRKPPVLIIALCNLLFAGVPLSYCVATASWMLVPGCILLGIYNSGCDLAYFNGVLHYAPRDRVPQYQAVHLFLMGLRGIIAPLLGPWIVEWRLLSMSQMFLLATAMTMASYLMLMKGVRMDSGTEIDVALVREPSRETAAN